MINKNELRIGNWAIGKPNGNLFMFGDGAAIDHFASESDPIPFTSNMLQQCGFTSGRQTNIDGLIQYDYWQTQNLVGNNHRSICYKDGEYIFYKGYNIVGRAFIKYLHTFQNLYFDVYGNELEYTPCK